MATECDECDAVFEAPKPKKSRKKRRKKKATKTRKFCHYCGYPVTGSDSYCSHCGLRLSAGSGRRYRKLEASEEPGYDKLTLPEKKGQKRTVADWRATGKEFEDFLEE
jgi:predicted amidophosphoribosyltransferase